MKPSVTKLIELLDKPALLKWANKIGLQGIALDDYRSEKKESGTDYHLAVENFLKFGILTDDDLLNSKMQKFFSDKEVLGVEVGIENEHFQGRYDVKFKYKDFIFVGDFKSNQKGVYFENKLQLSAYTMCEPAHACIIRMPDFLIHPVTLDERYQKILINLSNIYRLKSELNEL